MAGVERWYQKFEVLGEDSDTEAEAVPEVLDVQTERLLKALPPDVAESVRSTTNPRVREALLAINCFVSELHGPMEKTPARQQQLLQALSAALKSLEEGGEVETLLFRMRSVLQHPEVKAEKVEQALGACALLRGNLDKRVLLTIANASLDRLRELSASCLARICWSAASLQSGEPHEDLRRLLHSAMELAEGRLCDFGAEDASLLAWACATARPAGAQRLLLALERRLPEMDGASARIVAWALASLRPVAPCPEPVAPEAPEPPAVPDPECSDPGDFEELEAPLCFLDPRMPPQKAALASRPMTFVPVD
ncbi:unnamed protein product [Symbiodinium sp. CCMP2592]|nr:unnamed protein product [Symbiodinium sp. CCMP2592]